MPGERKEESGVVFNSNLSLNTHVKLTTKTIKGVASPHVVVVRQKSSGPDASLALQNDEWLSLLDNLPKIKEVLNTLVAEEEEDVAGEVIPLSNKSRAVEVAKHRGQLYCGIFYLSKDNKIKRFGGMNFGMSEWSKLGPYLHHLSNYLDVPEEGLDVPGGLDVTEEGPPPKRRRSDDEDTEHSFRVPRYTWKWVSEKDEQVLEEEEPSTWYYSDEACLAKALGRRPTLTAVLKVAAEKMNIRCNEHLVSGIFLFLLDRKLNAMKNANCEGCELDCPGQRDHVDGCLMEWDEVLGAYLGEAKASITSLDILRLYHKVLKYLGKSSSCGAKELEVIANFKSSQDLENSLKHPPNDNIYRGLLAHCFDM